MENIISEYKNSRVHKFKYIFEILLVILFSSALYNSFNTISTDEKFIRLLIWLSAAYCVIEYLYMLFFLKDKKVSLKFIDYFFIFCSYKNYVNRTNKLYIKKNIMIYRNNDKIIQYLNNTSSNLNKMTFKEIIITFVGFAVGASFNDKGLISTDTFQNALNSTAIIFVSFAIMYIIVSKIINNLIMLFNKKYIKKNY